MSDSIIQITGLSKSYPDKGSGKVQAIRGVDLEINKGDFVAMKGPSGCGKTTLLLATGGLLRPDTGEIIINGCNPYRLTPPEMAEFRARNIGFVFQNFHLVPYLTVLENVMICKLAGGDRPGGIASCAEELLDKFGLSHRFNHLPSELSIGEQQRVALARAICGGASIILADEPTGNLDTENGKKVLAYLSEFARGGGAVLMVTHDQRAGEYAFRQMEMQDGSII